MGKQDGGRQPLKQLLSQLPTAGNWSLILGGLLGSLVESLHLMGESVEVFLYQLYQLLLVG